MPNRNLNIIYNNMNKRKICYVWDDKLIEECDRLPAVVGRASMVHELIEAYGLINHIKVVKSTIATSKDVMIFHSESYLDHLKTFIEVEEEYMSNSKDEEFGLAYDCPPVMNLHELVCTLAGGSITAARCLTLDIADVAINWCGGWHHAHRNKAEGFCYVNDIVLAIERLKQKFPKVLYIDLDVHHGNGVENAYESSKSVFTLSFHKHEPGFFPGTGNIDNIGIYDGTGYSCNFPFKKHYSDCTMEYVFDKVFPSVYELFIPDAIVVQCGADALARDPHGGANLTKQGYFKCLQTILDKKKPTLLLGGGGYNHTNAARLWSTLTAQVAGVELDDFIPEHNYWPQYGPGYTMDIEATLVKNDNDKEYIDYCLNKIEDNLKIYLTNTNSIEPVAKRKKNEIKTTKSNNIYKILHSKNVNASEHEAKTDLHNVVDVYEFID